MKRFSTILLISILALLLVAGSASATPTLTLSDNAGNFTKVIDDDTGDLYDLEGVVVFSGSIGNFIVNVTTGITKPAVGSDLFPEMDLNSVDVSNTKEDGGVLTIEFYENNFTGDSAAGFLSSIGGTTQGIVSAQSYIGDNDGKNLKELSSLGPFGTGAFSDADIWTEILPDQPYSLKIVATISHNAGVKSSSFDFFLNSVSVPDATIMLLLGPALLGLAIFGRKYNRS